MGLRRSKAQRRSTSKRARSLSGREPDEPIQSKALRATKVAGGSGAVAGAIGVLFAALEALNGQDTAVVVAGLGVVAIAILAAAISTSVDVLARAWVTASEQKAVPPDEEESEAEEEPVEAPYVAAATPGMTLDTEDHGSGLLVLGIGRDPEDEKPRYLAAKPGKRPRWISHDEVASVSYDGNGEHSGVRGANEAGHVVGGTRSPSGRPPKGSR